MHFSGMANGQTAAKHFDFLKSNNIKKKKKKRTAVHIKWGGFTLFILLLFLHNKNKHICAGGKIELDLSFFYPDKVAFFFFFEDMVRQRSVMISGLL